MKELDINKDIDKYTMDLWMSLQNLIGTPFIDYLNTGQIILYSEKLDNGYRYAIKDSKIIYTIEKTHKNLTDDIPDQKYIDGLVANIFEVGVFIDNDGIITKIKIGKTKQLARDIYDFNTLANKVKITEKAIIEILKFLTPNN